MIPAATIARLAKPTGRPRRDAAFAIGCPRCEVAPGFACEGSYGSPRKSAHQERHQALKAGRGSGVRPEKRQPHPFYDSAEWRRLRYAVLRDSDGRCGCCGARPTRGKPLHVDHIKPRSRFPELALVRSNLQVLCADCNLGKGNSDTRDWRDQQWGTAP